MTHQANMSVKQPVNEACLAFELTDNRLLFHLCVKTHNFSNLALHLHNKNAINMQKKETCSSCS